MFYYHASWACSKLKLKCQLAEYVAVGLLTVLIDMPYDINGATYVHWIWHDTDPNICMYLFDYNYSFKHKKLKNNFHIRRSSLLGTMEFLLFPPVFLCQFSILVSFCAKMD